MAAKHNSKTGQNPVSAATVKSIRLKDSEQAPARKDAYSKRKALLKSLETDAEAFVKKYRNAKAINNEAIVLHHKFKDVVEAMRPLFERIKYGFAHLHKGETVMGQRTGTDWAKKHIGASYDWLCRCLNRPKTGTLLLTDGTKVLPPHPSKRKQSVPPKPTADDEYIKKCTDFIEAALRPLESDPPRLHRVMMAIAAHIRDTTGAPFETATAPDEFDDTRKAAVSALNDPLFAPKATAPVESPGKPRLSKEERGKRIADGRQKAKAARQAAPTSHSNDPA